MSKLQAQASSLRLAAFNPTCYEQREGTEPARCRRSQGMPVVDCAGTMLRVFRELIEEKGAVKPPSADVIGDFDLSRVSRNYGARSGLTLTAW